MGCCRKPECYTTLVIKGGPLRPGMQSASIVRFGAFEFDQRAGELRKHGLKIKLQDQPSQILVILLKEPGRVVTREELHQKLWREGTFVDFEHGLNAAIQRLRQALGDAAENPRFVETLARRGYRFVAPVDFVSKGATEIAQHSLQETGELVRSSQPANQSPDRPSSLRRWRTMVLLLALALIWGGVGWWHYRRTATLPELQVTPFTNFPGWKSDPTFSPDGKEVAFVWNGENRENFDIYVKMVGAGAPVRLTTNPAPDVYPAWSPDGRFIAFRRVFKDSCDVLVIPAIGGAERKLAQTVHSEGGDDSGISWSPDGKFVAIMANRGIIAVSEQTGETRILSSPDALFFDGFPAFSPDGQSIAFFRFRKPGNLTALFVQALGPGARPLGPPKQVTPTVIDVGGLAW
jgi:DNA-binding winged helix-turn-helix (wHTH) protein